jgi:hypothetical protein
MNAVRQVMKLPFWAGVVMAPVVAVVMFLLLYVIALLFGGPVYGQQVPYGSAPVLANGLVNTSTKTIKSTAGVVVWAQCINTGSAVAYIQLFDVAGAVTLGTTVPKMSIGIPANTTQNPMYAQSFELGVKFVNAIKVAACSGPTACSAATADCNFGIY